MCDEQFGQYYIKGHEVGQCPGYDSKCDGIVSMQIDPYTQSIYGDIVHAPFCDGAYRARVLEI